MALPAKKLDSTVGQVPISTKASTSEATMPVLEVVHGLEVTVGQQPQIAPPPETLEADVTDWEIRRRLSLRSGISARESIDELYRKTRKRMTGAFNGVTSASRDLTRSLRRYVGNLKEERPLKVLAVIGGTALALGAAARYWRERNHARR